MFYVDKAICTGCGTCIQVCSQEAISFKEDKVVIAHRLCIECGSCLAACPAEAIGEIRQPAAIPRLTALKDIPGSGSIDLRQDRTFTTPMSKARTFSGIISGLQKKWQSLGGYPSDIMGARLGRGTGRCHRQRGRHC